MSPLPRSLRHALVGIFFIVAIAAAVWGYLNVKERSQVFGEIVRLERDYFVISDPHVGERTLYIPAGMVVMKGRETIQSLSTGDPVLVVTRRGEGDRLEAAFVRVVEQKPQSKQAP